MVNSVDPDQTAMEQSDLGLHCLLSPICHPNIPNFHLAVACGVYGDVFLCCPFFPRGVLDEILNLIESVSEGFPSYSFIE